MVEHTGIPHNQEGIPYQAIEKELESQKPQKSFLVDQYHLFPIRYCKSNEETIRKRTPNIKFNYTQPNRGKEEN